MASEDEDRDQVQNVIAVQAGKDAPYLLLTIYPEPDPIRSAGQVHRFSWNQTGEIEMVLTTDQPLTCMWASPVGNLWVGSAAGQIWTTAEVPWGTLLAGVDSRASDALHIWRVTGLPALATLGRAPNITSIWGTGDDLVFAGTFDGAIYRWDGKSWTESTKGNKAPVNEIHGTGPEDVWAACHGGQVLHWDGARWRSIAAADRFASLGSVRAAAPGDVYVTSGQGQLLRGGVQGFTAVADIGRRLYAVALFEGRVILAAVDGAWEFAEGRVRQIKDKFGASKVFEARDRLFFIETDQVPRPRVVEHVPATGKWGRRSF